MNIFNNNFAITDLIEFEYDGYIVTLPRKAVISGLLEHLLTDRIDYNIGDQLLVDINTHVIDMTDIVNMVCADAMTKTKLPLVCVSLAREVYYASQRLFFADKLTYDYLFPRMVADYRVKEPDIKPFGRCLAIIIEELYKCLSIDFDTLLERVNSKWNAERNSKIVTDECGLYTLDKSYEDILEKPPVKSYSESNLLDKQVDNTCKTVDNSSKQSITTCKQVSTTTNTCKQPSTGIKPSASLAVNCKQVSEPTKPTWKQQLSNLLIPKSRQKTKPPLPTGKTNGNSSKQLSSCDSNTVTCGNSSKQPSPTGNTVTSCKNTTPVPTIDVKPVPTMKTTFENIPKPPHRSSLPLSTVIHPLKPIATKMSVVDVPIDTDLNEENCNQYITFFNKHYRVHDVKRLPNGTFIPKHALIDGIIAYATKLIPPTQNPCGEYNISLHITHKGTTIDLTNDYEVVLNKYRPKEPLPDDYIIVVARVYHLLHLNPYIEENSLIDIIFDMDRSIGLIDKNEIIMCIKCALHEFRSKPGITALDMVMNVNNDWNQTRDDVLRYSESKENYVLAKKATRLQPEAVQKILKGAI